MKLERNLRLQTLKMVHKANASYIGTCLSMADILAVLYGQIFKVDPSNPQWDDHDRLVQPVDYDKNVI